MSRKHHEDVLHDGSVTMWHAWKDQLGMPHAPMFWHHGTIQTVYGSSLCYAGNVAELIENVAGRKLFVLVRDILNEENIPYSNELLGHPSAHPYLSKSGGCIALRISHKKRSGFLVPTSTWNVKHEPDKHVLENIIAVFRLFDFQATTPSSLSEKVLRSTLPDKLFISRPSIALREDILKHNPGGRIDSAHVGHFYKEVYEYDKNKAYLAHARLVPTPFHAPHFCYAPSLDRAMSFATGYWLVLLRARKRTISPIQINGRYPEEGEEITTWLWSEELRICIEAGYTVEEISRGYGWKEMSTFMEEWSNILYKKWEQAQNMHPQIQDIIKSMMVGCLGRMLRQPMHWNLIPLSECRKHIRGQEDDGDIPLLMHMGDNWKEGDRMCSDYAMRPEYDRESTALCHIGAYIVMKMRVELYERMLYEHEHGRHVISSYIDCYRIDASTAFPDILGTGMGQWKEKIYGPSWSEENRFRGYRLQTGKNELKAPGYGLDSPEREALEQDYAAKIAQQLT